MNKKTKLLVLATILVCVMAGAVIVIVALKKHTPEPMPITRLPTQDQPTLGRTDAPIQLTVFEDLKCPVCVEFNKHLFPSLKKYVDEGTATYTMITLAFIPGSIPAGKAALCLYQQNKEYFFPFIDYLYHNQPDESKDWAKIPLLLQFAKQSIPSLSPSAAKTLSECIANNKDIETTLTHNLTIAEQAMGEEVETPTLYINGKRVTPLSAQNIDAMMEKEKQPLKPNDSTIKKP